MFEYVVMTPPPARGSAGIQFLNELTDDIRATGRVAHRLYSLTTTVGLAVSVDGETYFKCEPEAISHLTGDAKALIVIHGENQDCQYFMGMNVARYYLNRIGALRKTGIPREGEFKITWIPEFCDDYDFHLRKSMLRYPPQKAAALPMEGRFLRNIDLTYIGKGNIKHPNVARLPNTLELKRHWPDNDDEYFYLLKNARRLYTYDTVSSVVDDAITLGVLPVSMTDRITIAEVEGCVAHIDDDIEEIEKGYPAARLRYLETQVRVEKRYKEDLEQCCLAMEKYFGGV